MSRRFLAPLALATAFLTMQSCAPAESAPDDAAMEEGWASIGLPQAPKGGDDVTGPYELVEGWPQNVCGEGFEGGAVGGVFAASPDQV